MTTTAVSSQSNNQAEFDQFATNYDAALQQGLAVSGESRNTLPTAECVS